MRPPKRRIDEIDGRLETLTKVIETFNGPAKTYFESKLLSTKLKKQKLIALTAFTQAQTLMAETEALIAENDLFIEIESLRRCKIFKGSEKEIRKEIRRDLENTRVIEEKFRHSTPSPVERVISSLDHLTESTRMKQLQSPISSPLRHLCLKDNKPLTTESLLEVLSATPSVGQNLATLPSKISISTLTKSRSDVLQDNNINSNRRKPDNTNRNGKHSDKISKHGKSDHRKEKENKHCMTKQKIINEITSNDCTEKREMVSEKRIEKSKIEFISTKSKNSASNEQKKKSKSILQKKLVNSGKNTPMKIRVFKTIQNTMNNPLTQEKHNLESDNNSHANIRNLFRIYKEIYLPVKKDSFMKSVVDYQKFADEIVKPACEY